MPFLYIAKTKGHPKMSEIKPILTITGSDSTGGSGVQADIKTISELGGYAVTAVTSITVQTTLGIQEFFDLPAEIVGGQIEAVMNDVQPEVVKIGMIRRLDTLSVVVDALQRYKPRHVIYDAIETSSAGEVLVSKEVMGEISRRLLPLCTQVVHLDSMTSHGQVNRYASALAVYLSQGAAPQQAMAMAQAYAHVSMTQPASRASSLFNDFMEMVGGHFSQNSDVHYYADQMNVTPRYLAQVTRRISGKTPKAIIDEYLIREIERQLLSTNHTIQEIAYSCGFSSQAHLTKFFKKQKSMSPTDFRKQQSGNI